MIKWIKSLFQKRLQVIVREDNKIDVHDTKTGMSYLGISPDTYNRIFIEGKKKSIPYKEL